MSVVVMEEPCYELIRNMKIELITESDEMGEEHYEVEDPIQETAVAIEITINQYTQSLDVPELTLVNTTTNPYFYFLEGFLDEDEDDYHRLDELNSLVRDKTVNAQNLEKIKRFVLRKSSRIKEAALELRRADLCIEVEFDLVRRYGTHEGLGQHDANDMFGMEFDDNDDDVVEFDDNDDEDMVDVDDDNDARKPALQSSGEASETKKFENKEHSVEPCYELIRNMKIELTTESGEMGEDYYEVEDPIQETAVAIEITINQYTQSLDVPELTLDHTTNPYFYFLEGFLDEDNYDHRLDELNSLVRDKTVNAQNLEKIKRLVLRNSTRIKEVALELRRAELCIEVEFDLVRRAV